MKRLHFSSFQRGHPEDLSSCTGLRAKIIAENITKLDFRRAEASVPADKAMILKAIEDLDGGLERVEWTVKHLVTDFEPGAQKIISQGSGTAKAAVQNPNRGHLYLALRSAFIT